MVREIDSIPACSADPGAGFRCDAPVLKAGWPAPLQGIIRLPDPGTPDDPGQGTLTQIKRVFECRYIRVKKRLVNRRVKTLLRRIVSRARFFVPCILMPIQ
jgi:hypothetical protein